MEEDARLTRISNNLNRLKRYKIQAITLGVLIALIGTLALTLGIYTWDNGEITNGVMLEIPLGKLSIGEAQSKLEQKRKEILDRTILLTTEGKNFSISLKELGFNYTYDVALQQAYLIGRKGNIVERAFSKFKASHGVTFKPKYQWDEPLLEKALNKYLSGLNIPAQDACFNIMPDDTMEIVSEKYGKQVDTAALVASIKKLNLKQIETFRVPINEVSPTITKTDLENVKMTGILSSYTTQFNPNLNERTQNIELAAKAIDGTLLKPNQEFSFNQTVGPRTAEAGYQMATIIEGNEFVPGLGGGVCQVSSTLYNAVQLASLSLSVSERSHHSLAVTYVPPGQDATVAYPSLDFKFRNNSGGYLLIRSIIHDDTLTFDLYGKHTN